MNKWTTHQESLGDGGRIFWTEREIGPFNLVIRKVKTVPGYKTAILVKDWDREQQLFEELGELPSLKAAKKLLEKEMRQVARDILKTV